MKRIVFAVRDIVSNLYAQPFCDVNNGSAIRGFREVIQRGDGTSQIGQHPEDYELFVLGSFDDESARFELLEIPERISRGADHLVSKQ